MSPEGQPAEVVEVAGERPADEHGSAQVTTLETADLPQAASLADAVARAPGAVVQRLGGVADLATVALRGSGARNVEVLFDGVPLNPEGGAAVDLSELPLHAFARVEVARGLTPLLLGSTAIGGALLLTPADARSTELAGAVGSFSTVHGSWVGAGPALGGTGWVAVDALATRGDFRFHDDGGTRTVVVDDAITRRENNDAAVLTTVERYARPGFSVFHTALHRGDGVPGFTFAPSPTARYGIDRHLVGVRADGTVSSTRLGLTAHGLVRREVLDDPAGEIGVGAGSVHSLTTGAGVAGTLRHALRPEVRLDVATGARVERYDDGAAAATRAVARGGGGVAWVPARGIELEPAVTAVVLADLGVGSPPVALVAPRVGFVGAQRGIVVRANAGGVGRPPDLVERYGDRGALVGNPDLRPERGLAADLGVGYGTDLAHVEIVPFGSLLRDGIVWSTGPQGVSRPENVARVDTIGVELAAALRVGPIEASGTATLTRAVVGGADATYAGNQVPHVPIAAGWGELVAHPAAWARVAVDGIAAAGTFADAANFGPQPPRVSVGTWAAVALGAHLDAELHVDDLFDTIAWRVPRDPLVDDGALVIQPVVDFTGQPLPGRTVTLSVRARR